MKIAFLFPGQGSQSVGMCKDIYDKYKEARDVYDKSSKILNRNIANLCFNSSQEELNNTINTQVAVLVSSLAICNVLNKYNIVPDVCAGLSLGEYTALIQAGYLDFGDGLKLVEKRGSIMQEYNSDEYTMAAVVGLESSIIEKICNETEGFIVPANYNYSMQTVVSGEKDAILKAKRRLKEAGAKKVIELNISGAFHTIKLNEASLRLKNEIKDVSFKHGNIRVLKNIDATEYSQNEDYEKILSTHMISPVRMDKIISSLDKENVDLYVEVGPGRALGGFVRKELDNAKVISVNSVESLNKLLELVKE